MTNDACMRKVNFFEFR